MCHLRSLHNHSVNLVKDPAQPLVLWDQHLLVRLQLPDGDCRPPFPLLFRVTVCILLGLGGKEKLDNCREIIRCGSHPQIVNLWQLLFQSILLASDSNDSSQMLKGQFMDKIKVFIHDTRTQSFVFMNVNLMIREDFIDNYGGRDIFSRFEWRTTKLEALEDWRFISCCSYKTEVN